MSRIRAIVIGAVVAVCLVAAGQLGAVVDRGLCSTSAGTAGRGVQASADVITFLETAQKVIVRYLSF